MKNCLLRTLAAVLLMLTASAAWAVSFTSGDLEYEASGNFATVKGLTNSAKGTSIALTIPATVTNNGTTYRVYSIAEKAFLNEKITSVNIKWSLVEINDNAFEGCTNISWVRLPGSIRKFAYRAFYGCSSLKTVYWSGASHKVTAYNPSAFPSNSGMTLYIPMGVSTSEISDYKNSTLWNKFSTVTASTEAYDYYMNDGGLYVVGSSDDYAYSTTRNVTLIGFNTNGSNTSGGTVYSPIGSGTFCPSGQSITFKLTTISSFAFTDCSTIKSITIPATVTKLANSVNFVAGATALTEINVNSSNPNYSSYSGCLYSKSGSTLLRVPEGKTSVSYNPSVTTIGTNSHYKIKAQDYDLPYGVKILSSSAFANTTYAEYIYIPSSVTSIGDYAFLGTKSNVYIYINMKTPPTINKSTMFGSSSTVTSSMKLFVPYNCESAYQIAGWTGFSDYNWNGRQATDCRTGGLGYTVTSTSSTTIDGTSYDGTCKLVNYSKTSNNTSDATITVPASATINGKSYAVTMIGEGAFSNNTGNLTISGCKNVTVIGEKAFYNQPVVSYPFSRKLTDIQSYAFYGAGLTGTIKIPYTDKTLTLGAYSFANGKYSRFVRPASTSIYTTVWKDTKTLTELIFNSTNYSYSVDLGEVPSTCYIRVPVGVVSHFKSLNDGLKSRAAYITAGAYDYTYNNNDNSVYCMSIISKTPVTYNGTTYAGKAKYVYNANLAKSTDTGNYGFSISETDKTVTDDQRQYLITEIGDSLMYNCKFTGGTIPSTVTKIGHDAFWRSAYAVKNLQLPSGLTEIGDYAFFISKIDGEIKIPASVTKIGKYAFNNSDLDALYFPGSMPSTFGDYIWSTGNSSFVCWVPNEYAAAYKTKASGWGSDYEAKLAPWFKATATSMMFSSVFPTDLSGSSINAYIASGFNKANTTQMLTLTKANLAPEYTGLLLTDLTNNQEYRVKRPSGSVSSPMTNYFMPATSATNVKNQTVGYYWATGATPHFVKPTSSYTIPAGSAYLILSSAEANGVDNVYTNLWPGGAKIGDVDGNGVVDVSDVNIVIAAMLDKGPKTGADMDGNGDVDVSDVNIVIAAMLKE